jgi:glycerophosphoryl diester phosphodiesterase
MLKNLPRPILFGHRGASAHAPENTLASFLLALEHAADAIELDAKLSADGQIVVIHDQTVDRTAGIPGTVAKMTLAQLKELDVGSHFDIAFKGEPIPTLDEVFELVGKRTHINVELTNYAAPLDALPVKVAGLVKRHGLEKRVIFSSFNPIALVRARQALPEVPSGLLAFPGRSGWFARSFLGEAFQHEALHPEARDVNPGLIRREHRRGRLVNTYTVNNPETMRHLFLMGIDGIFTDDPRLARQVLEETRAEKRKIDEGGSA